MLALAGTTAAPTSAFPAVADLHSLRRRQIGLSRDQGAARSLRLLRYTVHVDDVRAICYAKDKQPPARIDRGNLDFGDGVSAER
ncbi:MAG: hypothetical protein U0836_18160 [Pirellulales bacterium]